MQAVKSVESFLKRLTKAALVAGAVGFLAFASTSAFASCGPMTGAKLTGTGLPALIQAGPHAAGIEAEPDGDPASDSIVGLWHVLYTTGGATFAESFKMWHSDGTELDNINQNPAEGSLCVGVWKQVGPREVRLHHVGWIFAPGGTPAGSFTIDETDRIGERGMAYAGTFTFRTYDMNGNYTGNEVTGNTAATRITVD
ncbi:MAG TPA: hypothetical protein VMB19_14665 [Silvibacterium sp.]|nr:hypothetical protein [Silvibacterium sp.]